MKNEMLNKAPDGEEDEDDNDDDNDEPVQGEDDKQKTTTTPGEKPDDSDELDDKKQSKPGPKKNKKKTNPTAKTASAKCDQDDNDISALDREKSLKCTVCDEEFTSRNKLFDHIKTEGHAALKTADSDQPLSHNAVKRNKRLAKLVNKK